MRRVVWSDAAVADYDRTIAHIAEDSPAAARVVAARIDAALDRLARMPDRPSGSRFGDVREVGAADTIHHRLRASR
ncbi:MAG: type II toxin-antitoxin system RelE/ParE family toxin [Alphaproteobacteria bacterium]